MKFSPLEQPKPAPEPPSEAPQVAPRPSLSPATRILLALAGTGLLAYAAALIAYLAYPGFTDHVEPALASIASRLFSGIELYPADANTPPFGLQYGPYTYLLPSLTIALVKDAVFGAKIASALAAAAGVGFLTRYFLRAADWRLALIPVAALTWSLLFFRERSFWARPDPYLLLTVCLAITTTAIPNGRRRAFVLGLLLGIAMGLKVHALLVFLPLIGLLWHDHGWRVLPLAAATAFAVTLLPFAFSNISLTGFIDGLEFAKRHGFSLALFKTVALKALVIVLPALLGLLALLTTDRPAARKGLARHWTFWAALPLCLLLTMVVASKRGAGPTHLVPFLPLLAFALFRLTQMIPAGALSKPGSFLLNPRTWAGAFALLLVTLTIKGQLPVIDKYRANWSAHPVVRQDLEEIMESTGDFRVALGFGDDRYAASWVRAELVRRGHPYLVEPVALMDLQAAAVPFDVENFIKTSDSAVDIWLFPRDTRPFGLQNLYHTGFVVPLDFQVRFLQKWERRSHTKAFDLWVRKPELASSGS